MKKTEKPKDQEQPDGREKYLVAGPGGATHQIADSTREGVLGPGARPPQSLFAKAGIADDLDGVIELNGRTSVAEYLEAAKQQARLSGADA
jgi:hypothetical protein